MAEPQWARQARRQRRDSRGGSCKGLAGCVGRPSHPSSRQTDETASQADGPTTEDFLAVASLTGDPGNPGPVARLEPASRPGAEPFPAGWVLDERQDGPRPCDGRALASSARSLWREPARERR